LVVTAVVAATMAQYVLSFHRLWAKCNPQDQSQLFYAIPCIFGES